MNADGSTHDVRASEDTWDLCFVTQYTPDYMQVRGAVYLHHECQEGYCFSASRDSYDDLSWPCKWCKQEIPKGLQALFVLMTGDMETTNE